MRLSVRNLRKAVPGVESSKFFATMRSQILKDLQFNRNDHSLAGRVDPQIADLVSFINSDFPQYVTSSSCSGRVSLFHKGKCETPAAVEEAHRKRGSFGRGTLFQSHDPLPCDVSVTVQDALLPSLDEFRAWRSSQPSSALTVSTEVLQLKFEPLILHILCDSVDAASVLLQCASESGQMNSGIVSCSRGTPEHRKIVCCITSPLVMDVPLFAQEQWLLPFADFKDPAWTHLLRRCCEHVNVLFAENMARRERFTSELKKRTGKPVV